VFAAEATDSAKESELLFFQPHAARDEPGLFLANFITVFSAKENKMYAFPLILWF
jgi:hypothetical protein